MGSNLAFCPYFLSLSRHQRKPLRMLNRLQSEIDIYIPRNQ
jgi:hypothetical protein